MVPRDQIVKFNANESFYVKNRPYIKYRTMHKWTRNKLLSWVWSDITKVWSDTPFNDSVSQILFNLRIVNGDDALNLWSRPHDILFTLETIKFNVYDGEHHKTSPWKIKSTFPTIFNSTNCASFEPSKNNFLKLSIKLSLDKRSRIY